MASSQAGPSRPAASSQLPGLPALDGVDPASAFDAFKLAIACQLRDVLGVDLAKAYAGVEAGKKGGDLSVAIPRFRLPDPKAQATKFAEAFQSNAYLESVEAQGTFIAVKLNKTTLAQLVLSQINARSHLEPEPSYGTNQSGAGKHLVIEYSSPNIAKPFHAGHLRSTIIGQVMANLHRANGWKVTTINYLGDWGKQFGLLAVGFKRLGSREKLVADPDKHLYEVYVAINRIASEEIAAYVDAERKARLAAGDTDATKPENAWLNDTEAKLPPELEKLANEHSPTHAAARAFFRRMEDQEPEALAVWEEFRTLSIAKSEKVYGRLNIHFDSYSGESQVSLASQEAAVAKLQEMKLVSEDKGALVVDLEKYKLAKTIVQKRDGTTLYITRDIGGAVERWEKYKFDKMIYVVASQQNLHLAQFFKVLSLMGYEWADRLEHITFGMVKGMSTRKGTAVFLEDILNEAKDVMHEQMRKNETKYAQIEDPEAISDAVGISGVKIQDMAGKRILDYNFDWKRMLSFEGDTGPYLQYAHVRLASMERKAAPEVVLPPPAERDGAIDTALLTEAKAHDLILLLAQWPDVVKRALEVQEPSTVVNYAFRVTHAVSSAYEVLIVKGQPQEIAVARLYLYSCAREVLSSALRILSLSPLERM